MDIFDDREFTLLQKQGAKPQYEFGWRYYLNAGNRIFESNARDGLQSAQDTKRLAAPLLRAQSEIAELKAKVFDLMLEIEALREVLLNSNLATGGSKSPYAIAYRITAILSHCSTGPSSGAEKLFWRFYHDSDKHGKWRECVFMERLGFSSQEIAQYKQDAENAEQFT